MFTHWLNLPNEIIDNILHHIPDLSTLANLVQVHLVHKQLFLQRYRRILAFTFERCLPIQHQRIAVTIQSLRCGSFLRLAGTEDPFKAILNCVEHTNGHCLVDTLADPLAALTDIAQIHTDIEHWTKIFFETCCRKPEIIQEQELRTPSTESPVSQTELYRIQRALWRFWLLCHLASVTGEADLVSTPQSTKQQTFHSQVPAWLNPVKPSARKSRAQLWHYQLALTAWESEELECVYYFLQDDYERHMTSSQPPINGNTRTALVNEQIPRIRRLLLTMGQKPLAIAPVSLDAGRFFNRRFFTYRLMHTRQITEWSDAPVGVFCANEGYKFWYNNRDGNFDVDYKSGEPVDYCEYHEAPAPSCNDDDRGPVVCFLRWGYCMWDRERLLRWCVFPSSRNGKTDWKHWKIWSRGDHGEGLLSRSLR
ncbi:MAG: hypothetical protein LQ337_002496 [Flavoplaca oasis]|nr:MAG: hypothetical protein LQ337_002496 [Flavoplaca oasis]